MASERDRTTDGLRRGARCAARRALAVAACMAFVAGAASRGHAAGEVGSPCRTEQQRVCGHAPKGTFKACLHEQADRLPPECRPKDAGVVTRPIDGGRLGNACRAEMDSVCRGVDSGQGRMYRCLRAHEAELSLDCRHAIGRP